MGCCHPTQTERESFQCDNEKILNAIKINSSRRLESLIRFHLKRSNIETFDMILLHESNKYFNALGLCAVLGNSELFELLLKYGSSISLMEEHFIQQKISLMEIICMNGYLEVLSIYFPYYLEMNKAILENHLSLSFRTEKNDQRPITLAVQHGHLEVVQYFWEYFNNHLAIPCDFNVHYVEDISGENSSFVACREGQFEIVKYLYSTCKVDFCSLNNSRENTLMVTVAGMSKKMTYSYIEIVEYLVETVRVRVDYNFEELLISAQLPCLVSYLEVKLKELGIMVSKQTLEKSNVLKIAFNESSTSIGTVFTPSILKSIQGTHKYSQISSILSPRDSVESVLLERNSVESVFWYAR